MRLGADETTGLLSTQSSSSSSSLNTASTLSTSPPSSAASSPPLQSSRPRPYSVLPSVVNYGGIQQPTDTRDGRKQQQHHQQHHQQHQSGHGTAAHKGDPAGMLQSTDTSIASTARTDNGIRSQNSLSAPPTSVLNIADTLHSVDETTPVTTPMQAHEPSDIIHETDDNTFQSHFHVDIPEFGKLGVLPFAVIIFYNVSGGPFGIESSVRAGGYLPSILGFAILPFCWSLQEALMTAELGTAIPESSGGVAWVDEAFGSKWAFLAGYLGWFAGATDNAIYPVLFMEYLLQAFFTDTDPDTIQPTDETKLINPILRFGLIAGISIILGYINWLGLPVVGNMSITICLVGLSPFVILTLFGMFQVDTNRWLEMPDAYNATAHALSVADDDTFDIGGGIFSGANWGGIMWRPFLNNLFWNLNSFDAAGSFVEDIQEPSRVLPRAMMWGTFLVSSCYLIPLLVAIGATDANYEEWVDGYLARITSDVVGPWLGAWTVFAAAVSNIGLFQAELSADALQLKGMADRGYVPKIFATRSRHGTPTYSIVLGVAIIVALGVSKLDQLIEMLNFNYSLSLLMEYAAFLKLRISRPDMERPYRIPLNTFGCFVFMTPAILLTVFLAMLATYTTLAFALVVNIIGFVLYRSRQRGRTCSQSMVNAYQRAEQKPDSAIVGDSPTATTDAGSNDDPLSMPDSPSFNSVRTVQSGSTTTAPVSELI